MAHAIWSGSITFGLVTIPVKLFTAVRDHSLHFNLLHAEDNGRIHNLRKCDACGKEVEWKELVRGYEYQKGHYVTLTDQDLKGRHAYALLREALVQSGKVGVARVVIRTREHIASLEPHGDALVLELM